MNKAAQVIELPDGDQCIGSTENSLDFDGILNEIGEFGRYQILVAISIGLIAAFSSFAVLNFVFSAAIPKHRCWIAECEQNDSNDFTTEWLKYAIPHKNGQPDPCSRYAYVAPVDPTHDACSASNFNQSNMVHCDSFITKDNEHTLAYHLNMLCTGQDHKLALLGTASTIGRSLAMPVSGILSDKFGRLNIFVVSLILGALFSTLQALPVSIMSFELYWAFEFLASLTSTGMVAAGVIYNMEWVTSKYRVRSNNVLMVVQTTSMYTGVSLAAWYFSVNFIAYKLALAIPGFVAIFLYLIFGESPMWLFTQNKFAQAIKSISKAAKFNGKPLQSHLIRKIEDSSTFVSKGSALHEQSIQVTFGDLLKSRILVFRLLVISLVSLIIMFAYFGIILGSVNVHNNKYLSFLIIGLADIPGSIINTFLMDRLGRKITIGAALFIYGMLLFASTQVPADGVYRLTLFFISKISLTCAVIGSHTYSLEFWPTSIRGTAYSISAMNGRLGSIIASVSVLLVKYHEHLPVYLYASAAIFGAFLLFAFLPETLHCDKLPDTIEEALAIGDGRKRQPKKRKTVNRM